jgi:hypothetical protein
MSHPLSRSTFGHEHSFFGQVRPPGWWEHAFDRTDLEKREECGEQTAPTPVAIASA